MESLIVNKEKLIKRISVVITELNAIMHELEKDNELNKIVEVSSVKNNNLFKETSATKSPTKSTIEISEYTSYDNPAGLPNMGF